MNELLASCAVGTKIWFNEGKRPYKVRARSDRYLVCTQPYNPKRTVLYTVIDLEKEIRGTENLIFGMGAETDDQCKEMIQRLEGTCSDYDFQTEVSHLNRVPLQIWMIES